MTPSKAIGIGSAVLLATLWGIPLARAVSFCCWAQEYSAHTGSLNAANDLSCSRALLVSYTVSALAALVLAWLVFRRASLVRLLLAAFLTLSVIALIHVQPERPIHLFAAMRPWRPALLSLVAVALALRAHPAPVSARPTRNTVSATKVLGRSARTTTSS